MFLAPRGTILGGGNVVANEFFMNQHRSISILLAAVLVVCPLFCATDACCAVGHCNRNVCLLDENVCLLDEHCHDEHSHHGDCPQDHHSPNHDDQHPDCICQGAVVNPTVSFADWADAVVVWFIPSVEMDRSVVSTNTNPLLSFHHPAHFPPLSSGRDVCDLVSSRLL